MPPRKKKSPEKVFNPATKRYVLASGKIGQALLREQHAVSDDSGLDSEFETDADTDFQTTDDDDSSGAETVEDSDDGGTDYDTDDDGKGKGQPSRARRAPPKKKPVKRGGPHEARKGPSETLVRRSPRRATNLRGTTRKGTTRKESDSLLRRSPRHATPHAEGPSRVAHEPIKYSYEESIVHDDEDDTRAIDLEGRVLSIAERNKKKQTTKSSGRRG